MSRTLNVSKYDVRVYYGSKKVYRNREEIFRLLLINLSENVTKWKNRTHVCMGLGNAPEYVKYFSILYAYGCMDMQMIGGYKHYRITKRGLKVLELLDAMIKMTDSPS